LKTLAQALADAATSQAGVRFVERTEAASFVSYTQMYARAQRTAGYLQARGIKAGDVVALILPTCAAFYDVFFGAMLLGACPVALYPPMRLGRMQHYHTQTAQNLVATGALIVVTNAQIRRLLGQTIAQARPLYGCIAIEYMQAEGKNDALVAPLTAPHLDARAFLQFSSGTTATPKPVALTHRQVGANIRAIAQRLYSDAPPLAGAAQHTAVSWLPLYHDMGLVGCMLTALVEQTTLSLIAPELFVARPAIWLRTISRYKASISAAPNFAYSLCAQRIRDADMQDVDLSHWQVALNGAEAVSASTIATFTQRFAKWGLRPKLITPVYGLAEAALAVTFASPSQNDCVTRFDAVALERTGQAIASAAGHAYVSVGTPLEGYRVRIVDAEAKAVAPGFKGHIQVAGPSVVAGYADAEGIEELAATDGWLNTGDIGFVYQEQLYIVARHKDLIIIRGRNIAPHLIEMSCDAVQGVRRGCVIAASYAPQGGDSEALVLLVERARTSTELTDAELVRGIEQAVVGACQIKPETVVLCAAGTLPRTSSGKLRRQAALSAFLQGRLSGPEPISWWRLGLQMLHSKAVMPHSNTLST
jgi:acyl-CoA synthetase (AMP-forming)/AMP-acid ligase II